MRNLGVDSPAEGPSQQIARLERILSKVNGPINAGTSALTRATLPPQKFSSPSKERPDFDDMEETSAATGVHTSQQRNARLTHSVGQSPQQSSTHMTVNQSSEEAPRMPQSLPESYSGGCYLPPAREGLAMLNEFLHDFNSKIPLFHPESLYLHIRHCYSGTAKSEPLSWVLSYVTFAIAHRMHAMGLFATPEDAALAEYYLSKSLSTLPALLMQEPDLALTQAMIGIAILLQTSSQRQRATIMVSTAMRLIQQLGYHSLHPSRPEDIDIDFKQKQYVFWIAFFMDTSMSLVLIQPNVVRLVDVTTPVPHQDTQDWWNLETPKADTDRGAFNVFVSHVTLAIVQAEALEKVFSISARRQSPLMRDKACRAMISTLNSWRRETVLFGLPVEDISRTVYRSDVVHCIMLKASHFRLKVRLSCVLYLASSATLVDLLSFETLQAMTSLGFPGCYDDAERLLALLGLIPQHDVAALW